MLWKELAADVIPVYLKGLGELKSKRSGWFRSGELSVIVGKAIHVDASADAAHATAILEGTVRELRDSRTDVYPI